MYPNFFIIGAPRSGTSSLHNWLAAHPDVTEPSRKETYFLSERMFWGQPPSPHISDGIDRYQEYFPDGEATAIVLESTASYIYSASAREVTKGMVPRPKVLAIVREPSEQLLSIYRYFQNNWSDIPSDLSFADFIASLKDGRLVGEHGLVRHALQNADYISFLSKWRDSFGESLKIVVFDDLRRDSRAVTKDVARWLGLDVAFFDKISFDVKNESYRVRNPIFHSLNMGVRRLIPAGPLKTAAKKLYRIVNTGRPTSLSEADRRVMNELRVFYRASNEKLALEFGLDLSHWAPLPLEATEGD